MVKELLSKLKHYLFPEIRQNERKIDELLWEAKYRNSTKGTEWLRSLSLIPNDMAINFSCMYAIHRILQECNVKTVLEFGLGQSSVMINSFMEYRGTLKSHLVIEHNNEWKELFAENRNLYDNCIILNLEISDKIQVFNLDSIEPEIFDFYMIDGPNGLPSYSRYDICVIAEKWSSDKEFIILMDDTGRKGEIQTLNYLFNILERKGIAYSTKYLSGLKEQTLIYTAKYNLCTTF